MDYEVFDEVVKNRAFSEYQKDLKFINLEFERLSKAYPRFFFKSNLVGIIIDWLQTRRPHNDNKTNEKEILENYKKVVTQEVFTRLDDISFIFKKEN